MESLTELDARWISRIVPTGESSKIRSLEGLETAVNLTHLNLGRNQLTDFTFLEGLSRLTTLELDDNQLTSLTLPEGLSRLVFLSLEDNQLTSLTLPEGLTRLVELNLEGNQLASLSFPGGLAYLDELNLEGNQLTDFSFLEGLTRLTRLDISDNNELTSLTLPQGLSSLTLLYLHRNPITSLSAPSSMNVVNLFLVGFSKEDITFYDAEREPFDGIKLEIVGAFVTDDFAQAVAVSGNYAYVGTNNGLQVIDISNPASPNRTGVWNTPEVPFTSLGRVAVSEHYVYFSLGDSGTDIHVIDVGDPNKLQRVGGYVSSGRIGDIVPFSGNVWIPSADILQRRGYWARGEGLVALNTSPTDPQRVGAYYPENIIQAIALSGNYAYVSAGGFHVVDVSDPASLRKASELKGVFGELAVSGDYVYVSEGGLRVIDVSDPLNPVRRGHYETSSAPSAIAADRNFAYVGFQTRGLELIDLSDPDNPVSVGGTSAFSVYDIALAEPGFSSPPIAGQSAGTSSDGDSASGDYVYVAGGKDGLIILNKAAELWFSPAVIQDNDGIVFHLSGRSGQRVIIQRSQNLTDWEDWKTMTLNECPCEVIDDTTSASQYFYRAVVDESNEQ